MVESANVTGMRSVSAFSVAMARTLVPYGCAEKYLLRLYLGLKEESNRSSAALNDIGIAWKIGAATRSAPDCGRRLRGREGIGKVRTSAKSSACTRIAPQ